MKSKGLTLTSAYGVGFTRIMWLMVFGDTSGGVGEVNGPRHFSVYTFRSLGPASKCTIP